MPMPTVHDQVIAAERKIDESWRRMTIPRGHFAASAWVLMTVCEDYMRLPLMADELAEVFSNERKYLQWIDDLKYGMKHVLAKLSAECPPGKLRRAPVRMNSSDYTASAKLLFDGMRFRAATIGFGAYHAGAEQCEIRGGVLTFLPAGSFDLRYRAREFQESAVAPNHPRAGSPILRIREWLHEPPPAVRAAIEMITVAAREVRSPGERDALATIFEQLPNTSYVLPSQWQSSFGNAAQITRILQGLLAHCAWSFLRVSMGEIFHGKTGVGLEWLAPVTTFDSLTEIVAQTASSPLDETRRILDLMTYGKNVQSPDPALQPFVSVGNGLWCYAPLFICGSSLERNFLALLARADVRAFDSASDAFELHMTEQLRSVLDRRPWKAVFNSHVPGGERAGEVDVIIIDPASRHVMILELWWAIPPGETREVLQRESTAQAKATQAVRKRDAANANLGRLLLRHGPRDRDGSWTVSCALVSETFLPISPLGGVPVLTRRTFQFALKQNDSLSDAYAWIASGEWLPIEGLHFTTEYDRTTIGDVTFVNLGVGVPEVGFAHAKRTLDPDA